MVENSAGSSRKSSEVKTILCGEKPSAAAAQSCVRWPRPGLPVPDSLYSFCGRKTPLKLSRSDRRRKKEKEKEKKLGRKKEKEKKKKKKENNNKKQKKKKQQQ